MDFRRSLPLYLYLSLQSNGFSICADILFLTSFNLPLSSEDGWKNSLICLKRDQKCAHFWSVGLGSNEADILVQSNWILVNSFKQIHFLRITNFKSTVMWWPVENFILGTKIKWIVLFFVFFFYFQSSRQVQSGIYAQPKHLTKVSSFRNASPSK